MNRVKSSTLKKTTGIIDDEKRLRANIYQIKSPGNLPGL
jgi:hypothetical protein